MISILITILSIIICWLILFLNKRRLTSSTFTALTILSLLLFNVVLCEIYGFYYSLEAVLIQILFSCLILLGGFLVTSRFFNIEKKYLLQISKSKSKIFSFYIFSSLVISIVGLIVHIQLNGGLDGILNIAYVSSQNRYGATGGSSIQIYSQAFTWSGLLLCLLLGKNFSTSKFYLYMFLLISVLSSLMTGSKFSFLISVSIILATKVVMFILSKRQVSPQVILIKLIQCLIAFLLFLSFMAIVQFARYNFNTDSTDHLIRQVILYSSGHLSAFSMWLKDFELFSLNNIELGKNTFAGIHSLLGNTRPSGHFSLPVIISDKGEHTNVFTILRFLFSDFGFIFTVILMPFLGAYSGFLDSLNVKSNSTLIILNIAFLSQVFMGFSTSLFSYNTVILSFFLSAFIFKICVNVNSCDTSSLGR